MIGLIAVCSINGIIGIKNQNGQWDLPFHYPDDMRHFRETTVGSVIIMGRKTFESMGSKPLPKRENVVITSTNLDLPRVECCKSVAEALRKESIKIRDHAVDVWLIGGSSIYQEGMLYANEIHLTLTPDYIENDNVVKFPFINPLMFELCGYTQLSDPPSEKLVCAIYKRKNQNDYYEKVINDTKINKETL